MCACVCVYICIIKSSTWVRAGVLALKGDYEMEEGGWGDTGSSLTVLTAVPPFETTFELDIRKRAAAVARMG